MAWCDVVEPRTLRACRIAMGQSQAAFAAMLGASPESYRTWDAGRRATPLKILARAKALATHPTAAPLNRAARDGETRRRLAPGESVRAVGAGAVLRPGYRAAGAVGGINEGSAPAGVVCRPRIRGRGGAVMVAAVSAAGCGTASRSSLRSRPVSRRYAPPPQRSEGRRSR